MRRRQLLWGVAIVAVAFITLAAGSVIVLESGALKPRFVSALASALNCDVTLDTLDVRIFPRINVSGQGLAIRLRRRPELPPFISVGKFSVNLGVLSVLRRHVDTVELESLRINVPKAYASEGLPSLPDTAPEGMPRRGYFAVDHMVAHGAELRFIGKRQGSRPLVFLIPDLHIDSLSLDEPMRFTSRVVNPMPEGPVDAGGQFGPWRRDDPTLTPLEGGYTLTNANLGTINGIGGRVTSKGTFSGQLAQLKVNGVSESPDFSLDLGGKPQRLNTKFEVTVDGTDGTTFLDRVDATLIKTTIVAKGTIVNQPGPGRQEVHLTADVRDGRIEDLLKLVMDASPPLIVGNVTLSTSVNLPPGAQRVRDRVSFAGSFGLRGARFSDPEAQAKIDDLSRRGLGKDVDDVARTLTNLKGRFTLGQGVAKFDNMLLTVPGATVSVDGWCKLEQSELSLIGEIRLESTMSKAVGGFKSIFLKPFNALFRKEGAGAVIPIELLGTCEHPKLGVRMKAVFKKGEGKQ
jgi:uncharacterized protein involved in outer membrane biogenesis